MIPDAGPEEGVYLNDPNNPRTLAHDYAVLIRAGKNINTVASKAGTIFAKRILIHLRNAALLLARYYAARRTGKSKTIRMNILKKMRDEYGTALNAGVSYVRFLRKYFGKKNRVITKKVLQDWQAFKSTEKVLHDFRTKLQKKYKVATTVGFGPRFLHSTGQLHKGDSGNGLFIQIISKSENDVSIPDEAGKEGSSVTFGVLIESQALGDRGALLENNRKIIRFDISNNIAEGINRLI